MLDLSKDVECIAIEDKLIKYANSVLQYEQRRRDFFASGGKRCDLDNDWRYKYNERECDRKKTDFTESLESYLNKFEKQADKEQIAGHFVWGIVELYKGGIWRRKQIAGRNKDFLNEGLTLVEEIVQKHKLNSKDKVRLLQHIIKSKYHKEVNSDKNKKVGKDVLDVLASFSSHDLEQSVLEKLYDEAVQNISERRKDKHSTKEIGVFLEMFQKYAENVKLVHKSAVVDYANLYFLMIGKSVDETDDKKQNNQGNQSANVVEYEEEQDGNNFDSGIKALVSLATKTVSAQKKAKCCREKSVLDKEVIKGIFEAYVEHVKTSDSFDRKLAGKMKDLMVASFGMADYSISDVKEILDVLDVLDNSDFKKAGKKSKLMGLEFLRSDIANEAKDNKVISQNPLGRIGGVYSYDDVVEYADNLFKRARGNGALKTKTDVLWDLVKNETTHRKELVLDIAKLYADSRSSSEMDMVNNLHFHDRMITFFQSVVAESDYDYNDHDVAKLQFVLEKGANEHETFADMAFYVGCVLPRDNWRIPTVKSATDNLISELVIKGGYHR